MIAAQLKVGVSYITFVVKKVSRELCAHLPSEISFPNNYENISNAMLDFQETVGLSHCFQGYKRHVNFYERPVYLTCNMNIKANNRLQVSSCLLSRPPSANLFMLTLAGWE